MPMRSLRALCAGLFCAFLLAWSPVGPGDSTPVRSLVVVRGPLPAGSADVLTRAMAFHGEYGGFAVGQATAAEVGKLRQLSFDAVALGPWPAGRQLVVAREDQAPSGETLFATSGVVLVAVPEDEAVHASCHAAAANSVSPAGA